MARGDNAKLREIVQTFGLQAQTKVINKNSPVNDSNGTRLVIDRTIFVY